MIEAHAVQPVEQLAREVVRLIAPEELVSFAEVSSPYLENPRRAERRWRKAHDDSLGFGVGDIAELVTPVIVLVSGSVVTALSDSLVDSVRGGVDRMVRRVFGRFRRRPAAEALALPVSELTEEQLSVVRTIALAHARKLGMGKAKAEVLADAIVGALVRRDSRG
jgi:hypothetical protein